MSVNVTMRPQAMRQILRSPGVARHVETIAERVSASAQAHGAYSYADHNRGQQRVRSAVIARGRNAEDTRATLLSALDGAR